jgi:hypothetical protein
MSDALQKADSDKVCRHLARISKGLTSCSADIEFALALLQLGLTGLALHEVSASTVVGECDKRYRNALELFPAATSWKES